MIYFLGEKKKMEEKRNKQRNNFTLDDRSIKLIDHYTRVGCFKSKSGFIEFLVAEYDMKNDPIKKLRQIEHDINETKISIAEKEELRKLILEQMAMKKEAEKTLNADKENAIETIIRAVRRGNTLFELQNIIKTWSYRLNITYEELNFAVALRIRDEKIEVEKGIKGGVIQADAGRPTGEYNY